MIRQEWEKKARRRLLQILKTANSFPTLRKMGPKKQGAPWSADVTLVGAARMTELNTRYRQKAYATDVLSFESPRPFRDEGLLGSLVICLPTLKAQAKSVGISPQSELEVLLVHGVLHLLGMDHEKGPKEARQMARWEARILEKTLGRGKIELLGLIDRSKSDI